MEQTHIAVVLGTARTERKSELVAKAAVEIINNTDELSAELVDVKDHVQTAITTPPWGSGGAAEKPTEWSSIVERSNALVLVIPEYNHGYPGELKLLLDSLWEEYKGKPVGMIGVSRGILGGARVLDHIKPVLIEMYLEPIRESVNFIKVEEAFGEDGTLQNEMSKSAIERMVEELVKAVK